MDDRDLAADIALLGEVMAAVAGEDHELSDDEVDEVLGVDTSGTTGATGHATGSVPEPHPEPHPESDPQRPEPHHPAPRKTPVAGHTAG